jgi:hypothetical protein
VKLEEVCRDGCTVPGASRCGELPAPACAGMYHRKSQRCPTVAGSSEMRDVVIKVVIAALLRGVIASA